MQAFSSAKPPRILGRYELHGEIAAGGMATVHLGRVRGEVGFSRTVAIKRLHPQYACDPEFMSMFLDEARLAARVRHPNVVPILDVVATEGELFLVMEYVQGETLSRLIRAAKLRGQRIPIGVSAAAVVGMLEGLHSAHEAVDERGEPLGIVHRDVSPQNLMVGLDGVARVLDFGVAKAAVRMQSTRDGQLKGKIAYMAPEQVRGLAIDRRTDVYSAAVVLWEALIGRRLFDADNEAALLTRVLDGNIEPPSRLDPTVPAALDAIVLKGAHRDPAQRFQTAQDMAIALERAVGISSAREVGRWVEALVCDSIKAMAARVAEIESVSSMLSVNTQQTKERLAELSSSKQHELPAPRPEPHTGSLSNPSFVAAPRYDGSLSQPSISQAIPAPKKTNGPVLVLALAWGLLLAAGAIVGLLLMVRAGATPSLMATPVLANVALAAAPYAVSAAEAAASASAVVPEPDVTFEQQPASEPSQTTKRPPVGARVPATGGDCNPPYTLDSTGIRIPKPHCM